MSYKKIEKIENGNYSTSDFLAEEKNQNFTCLVLRCMDIQTHYISQY